MKRQASIFATFLVVASGSVAALSSPVPTETTLSVTSGGGTVTTVASGSAVTLTATVTTGGSSVTTGEVSFCDASAAYCTDIHLLGTTQLTSAGTASWTFIPGVGSHSYKAIFGGTQISGSGDSGSTSGAADLTVTGLYPSTTNLSANGSAGNYTLTAEVGGAGSSVPTGTVSFLDSSNANVVLGTATLGSSTSGLNLLNVSNPSSGLTPVSLAVRDFNGDGVPDLAVANYGSGTVTVLLGSGNGMFTPAANSPVTVGAEPSSVSVGDFNGDGIADLAVANYGSGTVTILLGSGNGMFVPALNSPVGVGEGPSSVVVGDFNGDGIADLAVANTSSNTVTILLGNGDGTFAASSGSPVRVGNGPISLGMGDFNGDGILDLAVANASDNTVTILLGNGDGTFTSASSSAVPVGSEPSSIAVGDFNSDGIADLAVGNYSDNTVTILLGDGTGSFTPAVNSPVTVGAGPSSVVVGDFNRDGIPDLAVADYGTNTVTTLLGNGNGTFTTAASSWATGGGPGFLAEGDFNGDGLADLAVASEGSNTVTVLQTALESSTAIATGIELPLTSGVHQVVANYAGDGTYTSGTSVSVAIGGTSASSGGTLPPGNGILSPTPPAGGLSNRGMPIVNVLNFGAVGDGRQVVDGNTVAGGATLTSATAAFTPADNGKTIEVFAGPAYLLAATYASGGAISGTAGQTCTLSNFNGGGTGELATVALSGSNVITSGTGLVITYIGSGFTTFTAAPTTATLGNGTATCSGTASIVTTSLQYAPITTTITYVNASTATLGANAIYGLSNATVNIGTDNTAALTNAFTSAANSVLFFPGGIYLSRPLTVSNPVQIMGATQNATILRADSGGQNQFVTVTASNVGLANLTIDAKGVAFNNNYGNSGSTGNGIQFANGLSNFEIFDASVINAGGNGVLFIADSNVSVQNSLFVGNEVDQFLYQNTSAASASNLQILGSRFDATATPCATSFVSLYAVDMATGSLNNVSIQGNTVLYPSCVGHETDGIVLDGLSDTAISEVEIASNYVAATPSSVENVGNAIELQYVGSTQFTGNTVLDGDVLSQYGAGPVAFLGNYVGCVNNCAFINAGLFLYVNGDSSTGDVVEQGTPRGGGIVITGANVTVSGDTISTVAGGGSGVITGMGTTLSNNQIVSGSYGVLAAGANDTLTGNSIVAGQANSGVVLYASGTTITGNFISTPGKWGMRLLSGSGGTVSGNTISSSSIGVIFNTGVANATFSNNAFVSDIQAFNGNSSAVSNVFLSGNSFTSVPIAYANLFAPYSSGFTVQTVAPGVTVMLGSSSLTPLQSLSATVTVGAGLPAPLPTGSVVLTSGSFTSSAATLSGGVATITVPAGVLAVGSDTLSAAYTPDAAGAEIYTSAAGASSAVTVSKITPTVAVTPGVPSITTTQTLSVTVALSGGTGNPVPTGSVVLTSGSYSSSPATLSGGTAMITVPAGLLTAGSDTLSATYTPDTGGMAIYSGASGTSTTVTVSKVTPAVAVAPSASSITTTQTLSVTVSVSGGPVNPVPTGSVVLTSGSFTSSAAALSGGTATITVAAGTIAAGSDTLSAAYTPDSVGAAIYSVASGISSAVTVSKVTPTVAVAPGSSSITTTQTLSVTVALSGGTGNPVPTGSVVLTSGGYTSSAVALSGGTAMITVPAGALAAGSDTLSATYTPDTVGATIYSGVSGTSSTVTVSKVTPAVAVTPGASSITTTQPLSVTVSVSGGPGNPVPTGSVVLSSGSFTSSAVTLSGGMATITVPAGDLPVGTDTLTVSDSGDANYNPAVGTASITIVEPAALTSPTPGLGTVLGTSNVAFQWTAGIGVTDYQLNLSAIVPGGSELYLYKGTALSASVPAIPANGTAVYATLYSKINGVWQSNSYVYTESGTPTPAALTSPTPGLGTVLGASNVAFQWNAGTGVALYQLNLSTVAPGGSELYLYKGTALSASVPAIPANGTTVYATLYSKINGVWQSNAYVYTESGTSLATLTSPTPGLGTVLGTSNVAFQWTAGFGITAYQLNLSAIAPGGSELYLYKGSATSADVPTLPANGTTVYATLYSKINGVWQSNSYVYTESGTPTPAALTSPTPGLGTILGTSNVAFQWNAGIGVAQYQLNLSTVAPGGSELYLFKGTTLSANVPAIPANGGTVYATLYSKINGLWQSNSYVYTESGSPTPAALTSPTPGVGTVLGSSNVLFQWTAGTGVALYQLNLSTAAPGGSDLYLYKGTALSANVPAIPANGTTVYATLYSKINGVWQSNSYVYTEQ